MDTRHVLLALAALALVACGPEGSSSNTNNGWDVNNETNNASNNASSNNASNNVSNNVSNNATNNAANNSDTNNGAPATIEEQLVEAPWVGVLPIEEAMGPAGSGVVGVAPTVTFRADGTADLSLERTREGTWELTPTGELLVSQLPVVGDGDPDRLLFEVEEQGGVLEQLKLFLSQVDRVIFEQHGGLDAETAATIEGRWRSTELVPGDEGDFRLAMRFLGDTIDYGGIVPNQGFVSFVSSQGRVMRFTSGDVYWMWDAPAGPDVPPLAGQITIDAAGAYTVWAPYSRTTSDGEEEIRIVAMEKVDAFSE